MGSKISVIYTLHKDGKVLFEGTAREMVDNGFYGSEESVAALLPS